MYREFFARSPLLAAPIAALVIFLLVFTGVVLTIFRRRPQQFESVARLPLEDGEEVSHG